ncbi:MAG TPA: TatD family hydrolase [Candidatus Omnitrophota bacterium]|nr:TatD family hydrolase [Candidatus Omnitrophota bacterium]HRZ14348.1 TatD family hydrolase [Candidatus Omnitrophota bacterium]
MLQDAHIHLQDITVDLDGLFFSSRQAAVQRFFCCATSPLDWERLHALSLQDVRICAFYGVHPWYAGKELGDWQTELRNFLSSDAAGVGEIGLDGARQGIPMQVQEQIFGRQVDLAVEMRKPAAIHCLRAWFELLSVLDARKHKQLRFMVHAFSGTRPDLEKVLSLGGYVSFSLRFLLSGGEKTAALCSLVPLDRLLIETDFPYMLPAGAQETAQEYVALLHKGYAAVAQLKNISEEDLRRAVWENGTLFTH